MRGVSECEGNCPWKFKGGMALRAGELRKAFDEATYELRPFGGFKEHIARWGREINEAATTPAQAGKGEGEK